MSPAANLSVLAGTQRACLRIAGRANFTSSIDFRTVLDVLLEKGYRAFVLDLTQCQLMDSTFLGILAGFGLKLHLANGGPTVELLNANSRIRDLLETLGVLHLFKLTYGVVTEAEPCPAEAVDSTQPSKDELRKTCLEAHRTLIHIAPENALRFKEVAAFLAEDVKKKP